MPRAALLSEEAGRLAALPASVRELLRAVAAQYHLDAPALLGRRRFPAEVEARWVLMALLVRRGYTVAQVARLLGRDHSTILYGLARGGMFGAGRYYAVRASQVAGGVPQAAHPGPGGASPVPAVVAAIEEQLALCPLGGWTQGRQAAAIRAACRRARADDLAAHLLGAVLCWERPRGDASRRALHAMKCRPHLVDWCCDLLCRLDLGPYGSILRRQVALLGRPTHPRGAA